MATNLRLDPTASERLRAKARKFGRSQQSLIRDAVDQFLAADDAREAAEDAVWREIEQFGPVYRPATPRKPFVAGPTNDSDWNALIRDGVVEHVPHDPRTDDVPPLVLPHGVTIQQIIDELREDRF